VKKVLIDTNILFQLFKKNVNLDNLIGYDLIIPDFVEKEFLFKAEENKMKNVQHFLKNLENFGFRRVNTYYRFDKNVDDLLLKMAKEHKAYILTIDKELKKRAKKEGIKIKWVEKKGRVFNKEDIEDLY